MACTCVPPVIVDAINHSLKTFPNVNTITIGRNVNSSIDIPSTSISRHQCVIKLNENQQWVIKDVSSHKSTLLNNKKLLDQPRILADGDKITFIHYSSAEYFFYYSSERVPSIFKKRKPGDLDPDSLFVSTSPPKKLLKTRDTDGDAESLTPTPVYSQSPVKQADFDRLSSELEKYKQLYVDTFKEISRLKKEKVAVHNELTNVKEELQKVSSCNKTDISLLEKEKEILKEKLKKEEEIKEKMLIEMQELNECLKESELEQQRLAEEAENLNKCVDMEPKEDGPNSVKENDVGKEKVDIKKEDEKEKKDDYFHALALLEIVDLVEMKSHESKEIEELKLDLKKKDDQITDLALEREKQKQEVIEVIDRELLCSICSEVLYDAITLNCKHTFCKSCLVEWKNKKRECPVCRSKIKSEVHPLVIDSFVDRLVDMVGGDLKARRAEVKAERNKSATNVPSTSKGPVRRGGYQQRTPRRGRATAQMSTITSAMGVLHEQLMHDLSDIHANIIPIPIIDLTRSPYGRRGRSRSNYYNM